MSLFLGAAMSASMAVAEAHAHLHGSVPADGSVVEAAPSHAVLDFSEAARLTAAWIQKNGGARQKLERLPEKSAAKVDVPLPTLAPGRYELSWRALSADGHIVPGHIHFTISNAAAAAH